MKKPIILALVAAALLWEGCDNDWNEYQRLRKQGVTWNLPGYKISADEHEYLCGHYEVIGPQAIGGNGTLLGVGGNAMSVSGQAVFRIQLFSKFQGRFLGEFTCSNFTTETVTVRSKSKYEYEP